MILPKVIINYLYSLISPVKQQAEEQPADVWSDSDQSTDIFEERIQEKNDSENVPEINDEESEDPPESIEQLTAAKYENFNNKPARTKKSYKKRRPRTITKKQKHRS